MIIVEQTTSFKKKLGEAGTNGGKKWKVIKEGLLLQKSHGIVTEIETNGRLINDSKGIADAFTWHFATCAEQLAVNLPPSKDTCSIMPPGENWGFANTTEFEIVNIIQSLLNKNSSEDDLLTNPMLKKEPYTLQNF